MPTASAAIAIAVGSWFAIPGGSWSPTPEQVANARSQLEPYVEQIATERHLGLQEWSSYSFQYQGRSEAGAKMIFINAFCITPPPYAQTRFVVVFDGGSCFFQAEYLPEKQQFLRVTFNGNA